MTVTNAERIKKNKEAFTQRETRIQTRGAAWLIKFNAEKAAKAERERELDKKFMNS